MKNIKLENEERIIRAIGLNNIGDINPSENGLLLPLLNRLAIIEQFKKKALPKSNPSSVDKEQREKFFDAVSLILSCGFDYYYVSEDKEVIDDKNPAIHYDVLLNEEQFSKLRKTVQTIGQLDFVSYLKDGNDRYAIWLKDTPLYMSVTPFVRDKYEQLAVRNKSDGTFSIFSKGQLDSIVSISEQEHNGIAYKSLSISKD